MKNIGFHGGSSMCELGTASDMSLFFQLIKLYAINKNPDRNWDLLMDRLYCRYIRLEDLDEASNLMKLVEKTFLNVESKSVNWSSLSSQTNLNVKQPTLGEVFSKYFSYFDQCVESAKLFFDSWGKYKPVKIGIATVPYYVDDKNRTFEAYDNLEGSPFWMES